MMSCARNQGIITFFLLTFTTVDFSKEPGFTKVVCQSIPEVIQTTTELMNIYPEIAVCTVKKY
jgi:N-acetylglutamate synthase-like GNAT family acetyltransferase